MMHASMADFIASMPQSGDDWAIDLARQYIERAKESAQKEAARSLQARAEERARQPEARALLN